MKSILFTVVIALLCMAQEIKANESVHIPKECCFTFLTKPLPKRTIERFEVTSDQCPVAGVIFHTKKGHNVCAKLNEEWVKKRIEEFDISQNKKKREMEI
ncbi:C-C motif chemokine 3-like isoform X1 [Erpetoichthys calabaricus]|uniref:C-C motif chemokine 3-like isoform X1 n=1 Tax=Erpetoichthys calabaricus TaxID=27687 RepID=UPI00109F70F2|nr:C-C motif chemokine 3-like isoform X1 [Erpetoichthys calabaricus]